MKNIVIFASGTGSNAREIIHRTAGSDIKVSLIVSNKKDAGVLQIAHENKIKTKVISNKNELASQAFIDELKQMNTQLIVLAGFLWLIPASLIDSFTNKIINIHPALLPKYGGKGMYGMNVHNAVIQNEETESGITIHFVNSKFDEGEIIRQEKVKLEKGEIPDTLVQKIHTLEHKYFPQTVIDLLS